MKPDTILRHVLERIRSAADTFADKRQGICATPSPMPS